MKIIDRTDTATDRKGDVNRFGYGADDIDEDVSFFIGRRNIVKDQFVGQLVGIILAQLYGIIDILDILKLFALDDAAIAHIQARYNTFCQHLTLPPVPGFVPS
jgi:hypothetical protein